ncbi:hypothetical protein F441_19410 [Phytophthora nicotianae CJ01A1]|uniref:RxLR effector protein n=1 Tax=Phytophthora nicotianae CJ01A1 TaxID=1317063 RepID=W2VZR0_PHYNI|nr:hypothetical protein F441_19410 [Phytophthora nicotianae CJ01A1]
MGAFLLLLVLVLVAIASSNALLATTHRHQSKTAKLKLKQVVQWNIDDKRFLRTTDTADEERGLAAEAVTTTTTMTKTVNSEEVSEKVAIRYQSEMYKSEVTLALDLVKKGAVDDALYQNKISPESYFDALMLDPKLKFISDSAKNEVTKAEDLIKKGVVNDDLYQNKISPEAYFDALNLNSKLRFYLDSAVTRANNPNLEKFFSYSNFYYKSATDQVLLFNKISPEAYFEALKLDPKLKFIADSATARKNNPDLEKFYTYATKYYNSLTGN